MTPVDVAIVGGGPAGSSCAGALVAAGLEVVVIDRARFPRDKVCAGWITPDVVAHLGLDLAGYAAGRALEPLTAFRVSLLGRPPVAVHYGRPVSYGIRREEFDDYLLARSGARVAAPASVTALERTTGAWVINGEWSARVLVGAGGHGCPVARLLNPALGRERVVTAQRIERALHVHGLAPGTVELFFEPDLGGYGWIVPKGSHVNIGLGRDGGGPLPPHVRAFADLLRRTGRVDDEATRGWQGHAYLLASASRRRVVGDHVLLAGDAAGLAVPGSGEGISAAVRSGVAAAEAIRGLLLGGDRLALAHYARALESSFGRGRRTRAATWWLPEPWRPAVVAAAFRSRTFVRHAVLGQTFHLALSAQRATGTAA